MKTALPRRGRPRPRVVVDFDNQIIEMIVPAEPVAGRTRRYRDGAIVAPVVGVLAPGVTCGDLAQGKRRRGPRIAVGAPPQPRAAGTRRAALRRRPPVCSPECRRGRGRPETRAARRQPAAGARARGGAHAKGPQRRRPRHHAPSRCLSRIESIAAGACAFSPECSTSRNIYSGAFRPGGDHDERPQDPDRR